MSDEAPSRRRDRGWLLSVGAIVVFLALWWFAAEAEVWDPVFVPNPRDVWGRSSSRSRSTTGARA